jgi:SHS2 domain-containing protein
MSSYEFQDHTADIAILIRGEDLPSLLSEAAKALYATIGQLEAGSVHVEQDIAIEAPDSETLLHDWMAELLFRLEVHGEWFVEFHFSECSATRLAAQVKGTVIDPDASQFDREVKAVTFHDLQVNEVGGEIIGRVILDI